jgi:hypothetical protein
MLADAVARGKDRRQEAGAGGRKNSFRRSCLLLPAPASCSRASDASSLDVVKFQLLLETKATLLIILNIRELTAD